VGEVPNPSTEKQGVGDRPSAASRVVAQQLFIYPRVRGWECALPLTKSSPPDPTAVRQLSAFQVSAAAVLILILQRLIHLAIALPFNQPDATMGISVNVG